MLEEELSKLRESYRVCGIIDQEGQIYPLGADTKVLSTIFELVSRPAVYKTAKRLDMTVVEPKTQNSYPDFTLVPNDEKKRKSGKIALDVKTTYRSGKGKTFNFTLGGYTSFIRDGKESKNIVFPFSEYSHHWVIGFVYDRVGTKKAQAMHSYNVEEIKDIDLPFENVETFVQEKWRISSDKPGSGNTTNIGSIKGTLRDFEEGKGVFKNEQEFLDFWRLYVPKKADRIHFSTIDEFRAFKKR